MDGIFLAEKFHGMNGWNSRDLHNWMLTKPFVVSPNILDKIREASKDKREPSNYVCEIQVGRVIQSFFFDAVSGY